MGVNKTIFLLVVIMKIRDKIVNRALRGPAPSNTSYVSVMVGVTITAIITIVLPSVRSVQSIYYLQEYEKILGHICFPQDEKAQEETRVHSFNLTWFKA